MALPPLVEAVATKAAVGTATSAAMKAAAYFMEKLTDRFRHGFDAKQAARRLDGLMQAKTVLHPGQPKNLNDFYYTPHLDLRQIGRGNRVRISSLSDDLPADENIVVVGRAGQGKSTFLRSLAIQQHVDPEAARIPILVDLRLLNHLESLEDAIAAELALLGASDGTAPSDFLSTQGAILLLDGFDEVPTAKRFQLSRAVEELALLPSKPQIILSSRPDNHAESMAGFLTAEICPIPEDDLPEAINRLCIEGDKDLAPLIIAALAANDNLTAILSSPIMIALMILRFRAECKLPNTIVNFYDRLLEYLFVDHDARKFFERERRSSASLPQIESTVGAASFLLRKQASGNLIGQRVLEKAFTDAAKSEEVDDQGEALLADVCRVSNLIVKEGAIYSYLHKSLMEFYSARWLSNRSEADRQRFYGAALRGSPRWLPELGFLATLDPLGFAEGIVVPSLEPLVVQLDGVTDSQLLEYLRERCAGIFVETQRGGTWTVKRTRFLPIKEAILGKKYSTLSLVAHSLPDPPYDSNCRHALGDLITDPRRVPHTLEWFKRYLNWARQDLAAAKARIGAERQRSAMADFDSQEDLDVDDSGVTTIGFRTPATEPPQ